MHAQHVFVGGGEGLEEILGASHFFGQQRVTHHAEFVRGENVRTYREIIAVVVNEFKRQHSRARSALAISVHGRE
jgi:hypothetical protein